MPSTFNHGETMKDTTHKTFCEVMNETGLVPQQVSELLEVLAKTQTTWKIPQPGDKLSNGATLLEIKAQSFHPGDHYLFTVLAKYQGEYVTWTYNAEHDGCGGGSYFNSRNFRDEDCSKLGVNPPLIRATEHYKLRHRPVWFNPGRGYAHGKLDENATLVG